MATLILPALYILSSLILVCGATLIYTGNRHSPKHRAFALLFFFMACWQQSALLVFLTTPEQAKYVFVYGLVPTLLVSFMLLLHAVYLISKVYIRKYALIYKLLFIPPIVNILLLPFDGWLYSEPLVMYSEEQPFPGPGSFINFGIMFIYLIVMVSLLLPSVRRKHRPSQIWLIGLTSFVGWVAGMILLGELTGTWNSFLLVPFGINFWAAAVYISVYKYDSLPSYERRYHILFEKAPIGILITDQEGVIHEASPRAAQYLDIPLHNLIGHTIFEQLDEQERVQQLAIYADNYAKRKTIQQHELTLQDRIGNKRDIAISSDFIEMEGEAFQLLMIYDITETKRRERQIHQLAYYDHLTGLYNRASFHEAFEEWQHTRKEFVLILFDLDAFKTINDRYGHLAGDQALKHFATLLAGSVEEGDIVARMSGDEFVILLSRTESTEKVIQSIKMRLRQPYELSGGHLVKLSVSIGTALYPVDGMTLDEVFKIADDRMYAIKHVRQTRANT